MLVVQLVVVPIVRLDFLPFQYDESEITCGVYVECTLLSLHYNEKFN